MDRGENVTYDSALRATNHYHHMMLWGKRGSRLVLDSFPLDRVHLGTHPAVDVSSWEPLKNDTPAPVFNFPQGG